MDKKNKNHGYFSPEAIAKNRRSRCGRYTLILSILIILIVVVANLIVNRLPDQCTRFDTSEQGLYSLSQQTEDVALELNSNVSIDLIAPKGKEDSKISRLLERYAALSDHIPVQFVDPVLSPSFVQEYTSDTLEDNSLIVVGQARARVIRYSDIYQTAYDYYTGNSSESFDCESQVTSAIRYVSSAVLNKAYELTGHGEAGAGEAFVGSVNKDGMELDTLNLISAGRVPEDASCLMLNAPTADLTQQEAAILSDYLEKGGRLLLLTGNSDTGFANLNALLTGYGVTPQSGVIVEADGNYCVPSYPTYLLPVLKSHSITQPLIDGKSLTLVENAHGIQKLSDCRSTLTVTPLAVSSASSYAKAEGGSIAYTEGDLVGPFNIGVAVSEATVNGDTRLVWFASDSMLNEDNNEMVNGANYDLILNAMGWMTDQSDSISIRAKSTSQYSLRLTSAQANRWSIVYVIVLPLIVLVAGILVWIRRKRAK